MTELRAGHCIVQCTQHRSRSQHRPHSPRRARRAGARRALERPRDPEWYRRAVFYEVLVRGFQDASGDGTGDIRGLTSRLDYLQWLGIDCIWLLPIYESPLRDGGYDIADYMQILPEYGKSPTSWNWSRRRTSAASGSSPTWS